MTLTAAVMCPSPSTGGATRTSHLDALSRATPSPRRPAAPFLPPVPVQPFWALAAQGGTQFLTPQPPPHLPVALSCPSLPECCIPCLLPQPPHVSPPRTPFRGESVALDTRGGALVSRARVPAPDGRNSCVWRPSVRRTRHSLGLSLTAPGSGPPPRRATRSTGPGGSRRGICCGDSPPHSPCECSTAATSSSAAICIDSEA